MPTTPRDPCPLRVERVTAAAVDEWRGGTGLPPRQTDAWQMVYVRSGMIEERTGEKAVKLRAGGVLFHQPGETHAMRVVGEIPPEVMRVEFYSDASGMDHFRTRALHAEPTEQLALEWLTKGIRALFYPPETAGALPKQREDAPYGAEQQLCIYLENILILLARRLQRPRKISARQRAERRHRTLVEQVRGYFSEHLEEELTLAQVCQAIGCSQWQLQQAFRARLRHGAMEEFAAMKLDYAAQLLARGEMPGAVAKRLGYASGAYFSQRFRAATGHTPSAYRRSQLGLPPHRPETQQKDKPDEKTSIPTGPSKA